MSGKVIYYCPAFDLIWGESWWIGEGELRIKMCPEKEEARDRTDDSSADGQ